MANYKKTPGSLSARYQIKVKGKIHENWSDWFSGMEITSQQESQESQESLLDGIVTDQAALRGILCKIWDLNLTILLVIRIEDTAQIEGKNE